MLGADENSGSLFCYVDLRTRVPQEYPLRAVTVGADNACDSAEFVANRAALSVGPHVARNNSDRRSNIAEEVAESAPYRASQVHRMRIEEVFASVTTLVGLWKTRHCGLARVDWQFTLVLAAYDPVRRPKLLRAAA